MALFTVPQMIQRLTRGFVKMTGREPDGLEKIKIRLEALEKIKQQDKVVDMEGNVIDTSKGIMGGRQIKKAMGGRIGYKIGSIDKARRAFLKTMGAAGAGITALKTGLLGLGKEAAPAVEAVKETVTQAPSYFFDLVAKIKILGEPKRTPSYRDRVNEYQYTGKDGNEYLLTEELDTGDIMIQKDKIGGRSFEEGSYDVIEDRTEMVFRKGQADETTKGTPADEYEEYKVEFDQDGTAADATEIDDLSRKEIIEEVSAGGGNVPESFYKGPDAISRKSKIKKAGGGIARMLGE